MAKKHSFARWPPGTKRGSPASTLEHKDRKVAQGEVKICIGTHNMNGGLNWTPSMNSDSKAKDYSQWLNETEGILLLQDTGVVSERVPGDVKAHFGRNNIAVWARLTLPLLWRRTRAGKCGRDSVIPRGEHWVWSW
jgi:hypothetical protein